jgi:endonuclease I
MNVNFLSVLVSALLGSAALAACGDDESRPGDTAVTDTVDAGDDAPLPDVEADTYDDSSVDGADSVDDGTEDTAETLDTSEDTAETSDTGEDTIPDVAPDTFADTTDVLADTTDVLADTTPDTSEDTTPDPYAGLVDAALRAVLLAETTMGHTPLGYNGGRDAMYAVGGIDDVGGRIECIYTGRTVDATGSRTPNRNCKRADGTPITCNFNTEHTWARYYLRAALTENSPAYNAAEGDIHHLRPSDDDVNNARWHFDFGFTNCPDDGACKVSEESQLGQRPGLTGYTNCPTGTLSLGHVCLMEVRPARRGDIARGMFYMSVRYGMPMADTMEADLRVWNLSDPPDAREQLRNDGAEAAQGNRNPFIDRPDLVDRIGDF